MKEIEKSKENFLDYLKQEKNRKEKTIRNYDLYLNRFIEKTKISNPEAIQEEDIEEFKNWLQSYTDKYGEEINESTQNYHLIALRSFFKFLQKERENVAKPSKIELIQTPNREIKTITPEDIKRILSATQKDVNKDILSLRDRSVIDTFLSIGLKVSELSKLKKKQINLDNGHIKLEKATVKIPLAQKTKENITKYLNQRGGNNPFVFVSHDNRTNTNNENKPISERSLQRLVKKQAKKAGIPYKVTPNILRNTCLMHLLKNNANLMKIKELAGHESIHATKYYKTKAKKIKKNTFFSERYGDLISKLK
ncbi:MAG: tyrosine-type recombinase/integrase [Candidatus Magasanikbacteria bacterium]